MLSGHGRGTYVRMSAGLKKSRAVAELLRSKREELGLTLRDVEKRSAEAGEIIPFPTLARVEQGRVDPGVRRFHLLLRLYQVPFDLAADLIELEDFAGAMPRSKDAQRLYNEAHTLWKKGETKEAVGHMVALQVLLKNKEIDRSFRQKALVFLAVMAGSLGKYHLSLELLGRLFRESPEPDLLVSALVQAGQCWNRLGAGELALACVERAEKRVGVDDHKRRGQILNLKASTFAKLGQYEGAAGALQEAVVAHRKARDLYGENRALGVRGRILAKQGDIRGALDAAREARSHAERHGFTRLVSLRMIDEGQALLLVGDAEKSVSVLRKALGEAVTEGDRHAEFHAHHGLWKAYAALEHREQAAFEFQAARNCVRFVDEASEEAEEVRSVAASQERRPRGRPPGRRRVVKA